MMELANTLRRVPANSEAERELLASGFVIVEQDDKSSILRRARRAGDCAATTDDLRQYRQIQHEVLEGIAGEFQAVGYQIEAEQVRWAVEEFRSQMSKRINGRRIR